MRSICLLGVQVAVEGKGWMVLAVDNYDQKKKTTMWFIGVEVEPVTL